MDKINYLQQQVETALTSLTWPNTSLYPPIIYALQSSGKRVRPLLVLLAYEAFGAKALEEILPAALAVEFFHSFTLIHDDIMDAAPYRRGRPSVHEKFGTPLAILAGDALQTLAYQYLHKAAPVTLLPQVLQLFNSAAMQLCEGQAADMYFENYLPTIEEYMAMIHGKTAALISASLSIGALLSQNATPNDLQALGNIATHLGLLYQIQDDFLDFYGLTQAVGKQKAGDILQHKKTLLILLCAQAKGQAAVQKGFEITQAKEKIDYFEALFAACSIKEKIQTQIAQYREKIVENLAALNANTQSLTQFILHLIQREQ